MAVGGPLRKVSLLPAMINDSTKIYLNNQDIHSIYSLLLHFKFPGMNLQICFMNETASDNESPSSDSESCPKLSKSSSFASSGSSNSRYSNGQPSHPYNSRPLSVKKSQSQEKGMYKFNSSYRKLRLLSIVHSYSTSYLLQCVHHSYPLVKCQPTKIPKR